MADRAKILSQFAEWHRWFDSLASSDGPIDEAELRRFVAPNAMMVTHQSEVGFGLGSFRRHVESLRDRYCQLHIDRPISDYVAVEGRAIIRFTILAATHDGDPDQIDVTAVFDCADGRLETLTEVVQHAAGTAPRHAHRLAT